MFKLMHHFLKADEGATAIEYAMILALMFLAIIGAMAALGQSITDLYSKIVSLL